MLDDELVVLSDKNDGRVLSKANSILGESGISYEVLRLIHDFLGAVNGLLVFGSLKDEKLKRAYEKLLSLVINGQIDEVVSSVNKIIGNDDPLRIYTNDNIERFKKEFGN